MNNLVKSADYKFWYLGNSFGMKIFHAYQEEGGVQTLSKYCITNGRHPSSYENISLVEEEDILDLIPF